MNKKTLYFDNAATTKVDPQVIQSITENLKKYYGNPSSTHNLGRSSKSQIEESRKKIADILHTKSSQIVFTSGATEANYRILYNAVHHLNVTHIISSKIEHHAVLDNIKSFEKEKNIKISYVNIHKSGDIDLKHLEEILKNSKEKNTLVSLMHINNETGVVSDINYIGELCKNYNAYFHSDTVQSVGKTPIHLEKTNVDFIVCSAHKIHGTKGTGFLYFRKGISFQSLWQGGQQEKGIRSGTEATHNIVGMAKALEIAHENITENNAYLRSLKKHFVTKIKEKLNNHITFNAQSDKSTKRSSNIINIRFIGNIKSSGMLLFVLDLEGIACSLGSACQSGSTQNSHVLNEFMTEKELEKPSLRISFSKFNTKQEIDLLVDTFRKVLNS